MLFHIRKVRTLIAYLTFANFSYKVCSCVNVLQSSTIARNGVQRFIYWGTKLTVRANTCGPLGALETGNQIQQKKGPVHTFHLHLEYLSPCPKWASIQNAIQTERIPTIKLFIYLHKICGRQSNAQNLHTRWGLRILIPS